MRAHQCIKRNKPVELFLEVRLDVIFIGADPYIGRQIHTCRQSPRPIYWEALSLWPCDNADDMMCGLYNILLLPRWVCSSTLCEEELLHPQ